MTLRQVCILVLGRSRHWVRFCLLTGAIALATDSLISAIPPTTAATPAIDEPLCYMRTSDGRTINLSRFCGKGRSSGPLFSATDQKFLEQYQIFLRRRLGSSPAVATALNQASASPQAVIQRARGVCAALQADTPLPADQQNSGDADIMDSMAVKYYCPQLDN